MEIKDIQGNILIDALVTEQAVKVDELMKQHSITLSWLSVTDEQLPLGAYIEYEGVRYSLLAPYNPEQSDEATYTYKPVFEHPIMRWQHIPFFFYTYSEGKVISKELDWSLTDNPANFMKAVCDAILNETGEDWSYEISADLKASASQSFSNTSIFSALNSIASAFETEWWFDYANKVVYLSKASHGDAVALEVGQNIGIPSTNQSRDGYYTRFYAFGSTRNINQSYAGSNVNSIVNKRLTLDPAKYPNGYIDIREGLTESEILVKTLMFDDIYPRSSLTISDVKVRLMWRLDNDNKKVQLGTDAEGNPVYDQYAIWYFKVAGLDFDKEQIISGKALSVHFNSGALNGREFELTYHDEEKTVETSDGTSIQVEVGDFEINFIEEGTYIIPAITGLIPADGDEITLFNIVMPEEYKATAYAELEKETLKEIAKQDEDKSNYTFESNKVAFFENNPNLTIGRAVLYKNGDTELSTRIIKLETQIDYPFEQKITIGNEQIKGTTQTLKEEVVNANQNIDLISAINESTQQLAQSYQRTQKALQESMAKWGDMWYLDKDNNAVRTPLNLIVDGTISMGDVGEGGGSGEVAEGTLDGLQDVTIDTPTNGDVLTYDESTGEWVNKTIKTGLDESALATYLTTNEYLNISGANELYAPLESFNKLNDKVSTFLDSENLNDTIDRWKEVESFLLGYTDQQTLAELLNAKADATALENYLPLSGGRMTGHITLNNGVHIRESGGSAILGITGTDTLILGAPTEYFKARGKGDAYYNDSVILTQSNYSTYLDDVYTSLEAFNGLSNRVKTFEDVIGIDDNGDVYIKGTRNFYTEGGTISMFGLGDGGSGEIASPNITVMLGEVAYESVNGVVSLPAYPTAGVTSITSEMVVSALGYTPYSASNPNGYITLSALSGYATQSWVTSQGYLSEHQDLSAYAKLTDIPTSLPASDVYAWAKAATKPSYAFSEITGKPTTLAGYGITDFVVETTSSFNNTTANAGVYRLGGTAPDNHGYGNAITLRHPSADTFGQLYISYNMNISKGGVHWRGATTANTAQSWRLMLDESNYSSYALPKSGGTMFGDIVMDGSWLQMYKGTAQCGYNASASDYEPIYMKNGTWQTLIHSGNIGSQSVNYANGAGNADTLDGYHESSFAKVGTFNNLTHFGNEFTFASAGFAGIMWINYRTASGETNGAITEYYFGNGAGSALATISFGQFSGNSASATKLQTARSIWGQSFDGTGDVSGNILLGIGSDYVIGTGYSSSDKRTFNNITIGNSTNGIVYNGGTWTGSTSFNAHTFTTGASSNALVINNGGNVLIGTTEDSGAKLQVNGSISLTQGADSYATNYISAGGGYSPNSGKYGVKILVCDQSDAQTGLGQDCFGNPYELSVITTRNGSYGQIAFGYHYVNSNTYYKVGYFDVSGNFVATGTIAMGTLSSSSDRRLKDNINYLTAGQSMGLIRALKPCEWNWKKDRTHSYGFIAQDVEGVASCMITRMQDEELGQKLYLQYNQLHAFEVGAIQHLDRKVETQEQKIERLENKVNELENELNEYRRAKVCQSLMEK